MLLCTYVIIRSSYRRRAHCRQLYQCRNQDRQRNRQPQHHVHVHTPWMGGLCCHQKLVFWFLTSWFPIQAVKILNVVSQSEYSELKLNPLRHPQPTKIMKQRCDINDSPKLIACWVDRHLCRASAMHHIGDLAIGVVSVCLFLTHCY